MITSSLRPALLTAALSAGGGILVAIIAVATVGGDLFRGGIRVWLVAHGSGLSVGSADITLVPIGAAAVAVGVTTLAARWVVVHPIDEPAAYAAATGGFLGLIAGLASALTSSGAVGTSLPRAAGGAFVIGLAGGAIGYSWRHGIPEAWRPRGAGAVLLREAATAGGGVLGIAALVVVALLVVRAPRVGDLWAALDPGLAGGVSLLVACVLALPTFVAWSAAALLGPGFAVGRDTSVDLTGVHLGELPAFPLLGALPGPGEFPVVASALMVVPLLAGLLAGFRVASARPADALVDQVKLAAGAGAIGGIAVGTLTFLSSGALGPGRMAKVGPHALSCSAVAISVLAAGALAGAVVGHFWPKRTPAGTATPGAERPGGAQ